MKNIIYFFLAIILCFNNGISAQALYENLPKPTPTQLSWQDMELTMFIHFGPATWQDQEYDDLSTPLSKINPSKLNTDQWANVAKSYGAKMIIFSAKHTGGFAWWQTETTNYGIKETPWKNGKGDLLKDLATSCKKNGLKLGIYLSPEDRYLGAGMGGKIADPIKQEQYEKIYRKQLTELLTQYGDISEVWVDGSLVFNIGDLLKKYAPNAVILQSSSATIRWVGNELGFAPYPAWNSVKYADAKSGNSTASHSSVNGDVWLPIESDVSIRRPNWFWKTWNEDNLLTIDELMKIYYSSVGRGTVLLLNACPDTTGLIAKAEAKRFAEFGNEINRRFSKPLNETRGTGDSLILKMKNQEKVDHIILMEDISQGERIRNFIIEGRHATEKDTLFKGSAIGHKLIIQIPSDKQYDAFCLKVNKSIGEPLIRKMSVYNVGSPYIDIPKIKDNWNLRHVSSYDIMNDKSHILSLDVDITEFCNSAEEYELAYVLNKGENSEPGFAYDWANTGKWEDNIKQEDRLVIKTVDLIFAGVESNHYLHNNNGLSDRVVFNVTGIPNSLIIKTNILIPTGISGSKLDIYLLKK